MRIDRRGLLIGGGVGLGLLVAWQLWPDGDAALPVPEGGRAIGGLLTLAPDGTITIHSPQVETGQGIWTALAMLVADEMGARLDDIAVQPLQAGGGFDNPAIERAFGADVRFTGAGTSVEGFALAARKAAATMRDLLLAEAAERTGSSAEDLMIGNGVVDGGPRPIPLADLAEGAAERRAPLSSDLRNWGAGGLVGSDAPRVDLPAKMRGSWRFASDVRLPQMLHAAVRLPPAGGRITGLDRTAATATPGLVEIVETETYVATLGETGWAAERALAAARVRFSTQPIDNDAIERALDAALDSGDARNLLDIGDAERAIRQAQAPFAARYSIAPLVHRGLEPVSAIARPRSDGGVDVWAGTQAPDATRAAIAEMTGLGAGAVRLIPMAVGGGSGRMAENDAAPVAADLANRVGRPVQVTLSHRQGQSLAPVRPPLAALVQARIGDGRIAAWQARYAGLPGLGAMLARADGGTAQFRVGEQGLPYAIPDQRIEAVEAELALRTGYHAGEDALHTFVTESVVDELARLARGEPLSFRLSMLAGDFRMVSLLRRAADTAGWDGGGPGSRMGIACATIRGSRIACVAEASLTGTRVEVHRLVAAVDCGAAVHPGLVEQQVAGGLLQGARDAILAAPTYVDAMSFDRARPGAALAQKTEVEVVVLPSDQPPTGVTPLGPAIAPAAIANALAADQGPRLRRLPFALDGTA